MLCHVALCTPPFTTLTYATPEGFPGFDWKPGLRVAVPLGNGAIRVGVVTAVFPDGDKRAFAGASAGQRSGLLLLGSLNCRFVVGGGFPLLKADGIGGAGGQAITQSVAVILASQLSLAVHHFNGPFMTGRRAGAAAVALLFVDFNDLSQHRMFLRSLFYSSFLTLWLYHSRIKTVNMLL